MTTRYMAPAELEAMLRSQVADAREARAQAADRKRQRASTGAPRRTPRIAPLLAVTALMIGAVGVFANHGGSFIDLTDNGTRIEHNDALFTQGGIGAGTGNFDPFLTMSPGGSTPTESGYNICSEPVFSYPTADCPDPQFDELTGGDRTHELLASVIPVNTVDGIDYREFFLDSNDSGSEPFMSIQVIKLFLDAQPDLTDYDVVTESFGNDTGTSATKTWDLDGDGDQTILMNTQGLESGSGVSDISVLIPDDLFPADCFYGSTTCNTYVYFYTEAGDPNLDTGDDRNWGTTAGFEEWRIELLPVVNVQKSVDIDLTRTFPWDVAKEADGEPDSIDLFAGDTATIDWTVTATVGTAEESDLSVSGEIDILNPTGPGFAIEAIPATIVDVEDVLTLGGIDTTADVTCPGGLPQALAAGATLTCTYTSSPSSATDGTNTATVTIETNDEGATHDYSDTEAVDFDLANVTEVDECIEVTDDNATPGDASDDLLLDAELCEDEAPGSYPVSTTVGPFDVEDCGQVTITNRADTLTNDTDTPDFATDSVVVNCHELSVSKTANEALTRTYPWDVAKEADGEPDSIDLFAGDTATIDWTVTATVGTADDSGWLVSGTITVNNPAPIAADDVAVSDSVSGAGAAAVDCDPVTAGNQATVDIAANSSAQCTYSLALSDGTNRTNTATATLFGEQYTGTAPVNFAEATVTEVDECIEVTDDNATPGDASDDLLLDAELCEDEAPGSYPVSTTVGPFDVEDCGQVTITNRADTLTNDTDTPDSATDSVVVNCHELSVSKTAETSFNRNFDWMVAKTRVLADGEVDGDGILATLTLDPDQTFTLTYEITVDLAGDPGYTDSNWAVAGVITVNNPAPIAADDVAVSDSVSGVGAAAVDCDPVTAGDQATVDIAANSSAQCTYSLAMPDGTDRTNTATATLFGENYSGDAAVAFGSADITEIDECVVVTDDNGTPMDASDDVTLDAELCADEAPETYTHTIDVGPFEVCGEYPFTNTAHIVTVDDENDTGESHESSFLVTITVPCPEGCTLTQGYWKTHNETFPGGAPADDNWFLIGDVDGDGFSEGELEDFFDTGITWYDVFWTNVAGRPYYQLAHQWMAAYLNKLSIEAEGGSIPAEVQAALDAGAALLDEYDGSEAGKNPDLKGKNAKTIRAEFTELASTLGDFNEGTTGPGHCDEDGSSDSSLVLPPLLPARRRRDA